MVFHFPLFSITNPIYVNCKASVNIVVSDLNGYVLKQVTDYEGGFHPSHPLAGTPNNRHNNHPAGSEFIIPAGTTVNILVQNLSRNGVPIELELFRPFRIDETNSVIQHQIKEQIKAGERRTFTVQIQDYQPDNPNAYYKLNCNVQNGLDFSGACTTTIPTVVSGGREIWQNPAITEESQKAWMPYTPTGGGGSTPTPTPVVYYTTNTTQILPVARQSNQKPTPEQIVKYVVYGVVIIVIILILLILYRNVQRKNSES